MKKNILITGGNGFLGSKLIKKINKKKYNIFRLSNLKFKNQFNNYGIFNYDKSSYKKLLNYNIFCIIHLATCYGKEGENKKKIFDINVQLPLKIFKTFSKNGLKYFINTDTYFSKNINYGKQLNNYVHSKKLFLKKIRQLPQKNTNIINCKIFHMYGEKDNKLKFLPQIISKLKDNENIINLTSCKQPLDFVHVDDVVNAYIRIIDNIFFNNKVRKNYEIGSGKGTVLKKIVLLLKKKTKSSSKLIFGALPNRKNEKNNNLANIKNLVDLKWIKKKKILDEIKNLIKYN